MKGIKMINLFFGIFFLFFTAYNWKQGTKEDLKSLKFLRYAVAGLDLILGIANFHIFFML